MADSDPEKRSEEINEAARRYLATRPYSRSRLLSYLVLLLGSACVLLAVSLKARETPLLLAGLLCYAAFWWMRRRLLTGHWKADFEEQLLRRQQEAGVMVEPPTFPPREMVVLAYRLAGRPLDVRDHLALRERTPALSAACVPRRDNFALRPRDWRRSSCAPGATSPRAFSLVVVPPVLTLRRLRPRRLRRPAAAPHPRSSLLDFRRLVRADPSSPIPRRPARACLAQTRRPPPTPPPPTPRRGTARGRRGRMTQPDCSEDRSRGSKRRPAAMSHHIRGGGSCCRRFFSSTFWRGP